MIRLALFYGTRPIAWGMTAIAGALLLALAAMDAVMDEPTAREVDAERPRLRCVR